MLTILHGDNLVQSRNRLHEMRQKAKSLGKDVVILPQRKISLTAVIEACEVQSFFGDEKIIVIEDLWSMKSKTVMSKVIDYLIEDNISLPEIIFWQNKKLTKTQTKKFGKAKVEEFKTDPLIFNFLDSLALSPKKNQLQILASAIKAESADMVFYMLSRHVRNLILALSGDMKGAPWQVNKAKSQSSKIGEERLVQVHRQLTDIDRKMKTGQSAHDLQGELALLVVSM